MLASALPASAQEPTRLPGITIVGATLERAPIAKPQPAPDPAPTPPAAPARPRLQPAPSAPAAQAPVTPTAALPDLAAASPAVPAGVVLATDTNASVAGIPLAEVGTAVTVVTASDLRSTEVRHVADALRGLPGVDVRGSGSVGSLTQVRIRGAEGKHTRVVIDGIEVNTTKDGEFDFSNLTTEDIERIEVVRGPMSSVYGPGALGGVINIETKSYRGPLQLQLRSEVGSFGTRDLAARIAGGNEKAYIALSGQWRDIKGFPIAPDGNVDNATRIGSFAFKAGAKITPEAEIDVVLRRTEKKAAFDDFGSDTAKVRQYVTADDADNVLHQSSTLAGVRLRWDMFDGRFSQEVKANRATDDSGNRFNPLFGFSVGTINHSRDLSERTTFGYTATYRLDMPALWLKNAFTGAIEKQAEAFTPFSDFGFFDGDGIERRRNRLSYSGEWRGTFAERLTLTAGVRRDDNDTFQDFTTWRSSASLQLKELGLRPHASAGTGVKLPGMYDQFGPNTSDYKSNPGLRPETSLGWDGGIEATFIGGRAVLDVTYFRSNLQDKINLVFDPVTFIGSPENAAGTSTRQGVEISSRYKFLSTASIDLAYTYTDARDPQGKPEVRRPPHAGRVDLKTAFAEDKGSLAVGVAYNGRTTDRAFDNAFNSFDVALNAYWLATIAASYKIQPNVELFARVENAFDVKYQDVYGYNTAGIGVYGGVRVTFDDLAGNKKPAR